MSSVCASGVRADLGPEPGILQTPLSRLSVEAAIPVEAMLHLGRWEDAYLSVCDCGSVSGTYWAKLSPLPSTWKGEDDEWLTKRNMPFESDSSQGRQVVRTCSNSWV